MSWTSKDIPIKTLTTGDQLTIKAHTLTGALPGPHIHIQASVHGAELQGNAVILTLMQKLKDKPLKGSITFVPLCNPYATNTKSGAYTHGRFNPTTGDNWNRNFVDIIEKTKFDVRAFAENHLKTDWSEVKELYKNVLNELFIQYRQKRSTNNHLSDNISINLTLQQLAASADGILDLHTGPTATRYLYAAEYEKEAAKYMFFSKVLVIPDEHGGAMDESSFMPWIHLREAYKGLGRVIDLDIESFTMEFGSEETFNMSEASKDVESIYNYLIYKEMLDGEAKCIESSACLLKDYKTFYAPTGGLVDFHKTPGESYKKGEALASFYNIKSLDPNIPIESTKSDLLATEDGIVINRIPSSSVHEGMELYQVMTNVFKL
jgi:predicted deacylase